MTFFVSRWRRLTDYVSARHTVRTSPGLEPLVPPSIVEAILVATGNDAKGQVVYSSKYYDVRAYRHLHNIGAAGLYMGLWAAFAPETLSPWWSVVAWYGGFLGWTFGREVWVHGVGYLKKALWMAVRFSVVCVAPLAELAWWLGVLGVVGWVVTYWTLVRWMD